MAIMRDKGIEPPSPPFLVTPGATTLFHEWGHHVDHLWSGHDNIVHFSVRWFSHFYEVRRRAPAGRASTRQMEPGRTIKTEADAVDVVVEWRRFASELFAMLFEDWMRGAKRFSVDSCDPQNLLSREAIFMKLAFCRASVQTMYDTRRTRSSRLNTPALPSCQRCAMASLVIIRSLCSIASAERLTASGQKPLPQMEPHRSR